MLHCDLHPAVWIVENPTLLFHLHHISLKLYKTEGFWRTSHPVCDVHRYIFWWMLMVSLTQVRAICILGVGFLHNACTAAMQRRLVWTIFVFRVNACIFSNKVNDCSSLASLGGGARPFLAFNVINIYM